IHTSFLLFPRPPAYPPIWPTKSTNARFTSPTTVRANRYRNCSGDPANNILNRSSIGASFATKEGSASRAGHCPAMPGDSGAWFSALVVTDLGYGPEESGVQFRLL